MSQKLLIKIFLAISLVAAVFLMGCSSVRNLTQKKEAMVLEEFQKLNWLEKVKYLESEPLSIGILSVALLNKKDGVVITALKINEIQEITILSSIYTKLLYHKNPIVRLYAYEYFFVNGNIKNLNVSLFLQGLKDKDWLIKERTLQRVRSYPYEKIRKRLYYSIILMLKYRQANIIRETFKTLLWYEESQALYILYKRSYNTKSRVECTVILDVLSRSKQAGKKFIDDIKSNNKKHCNL